MQRVRFWGTRGSLPTALSAAEVRQKLVAALRGASGRSFESERDLEQYVDSLAFDVAGMRVTLKQQHHTGASYGYRFEMNDRVVVYSTDSEHKLTDPRERIDFADFFRNADVVIFDAMYSLADSISVKADWGHSSNIVGVELCQLAQARHLCLFHHEPAMNDAALAKMLAETRRFEEITRTHAPLTISAAYDGLELML